MLPELRKRKGGDYVYRDADDSEPHWGGGILAREKSRGENFDQDKRRQPRRERSERRGSGDAVGSREGTVFEQGINDRAGNHHESQSGGQSKKQSELQSPIVPMEHGPGLASTELA